MTVHAREEVMAIVSRMWAANVVGGGTRFFFTLPLAP
jgi:hypothetical protein